MNPSTVGQSVTFTATVTTPGGGVSPTGTVTFFDGATPLGTQALNGGGVATYTTATLANGMHQMTAVYNGNAGSQVQPSTSAVLNQDVQVPSTIAVVSSLNPSNYGNPVTFTATVTSTATSPATGTVNFLDNGVTIGSGTLGGNPGKATFTISTLVVGTHPITVTYAGDSYNMGSSSAAPLNQVVQQGATVTTVVGHAHSRHRRIAGDDLGNRAIALRQRAAYGHRHIHFGDYDPGQRLAERLGSCHHHSHARARVLPDCRHLHGQRQRHGQRVGAVVLIPSCWLPRKPRSRSRPIRRWSSLPSR